MTEYKRWVPVILFSTFLLVCYTLSLRYKTEPFFSESAVSPFSLPGSGLQISYEENECLNDMSWTSNDGREDSSWGIISSESSLVHS